MKNKQTAVEWLVEQLTPSISLQQKHIDELKEQAKQMEKEQIVKAYNDAIKTMDYFFLPPSAENYYNKIYKTEQCQKQNP